MVKFYQSSFAFGLAISFAFAKPVFAEEFVKHFTNHSSQDWQIIFVKDTGGVVRLTGEGCKGQSCQIKSGEVVEIIYPDYHGSGRILITDYQGKTKEFRYAGHAEKWKRDIRIFHSGATGAVSLNEPNSGDITVDSGDSW